MLKLVECEGRGEERGLTYGRAAAEDIRENIATYRKVFAERFGLTWEKALARVRAVVAPLEQFDRDLLAEMKGIARGAGVDDLEILALNARSTIMYAQDECTSIAFIKGVAAQSKTVIGQNWDNMRRLRPVILRVIEPEKPEILTLTEAGTLAKIGFNRAGIGVCVNGLSVSGTPGSESVPIFVLIRRALQSTVLSDCMDVIASNRMDAPHNFKVASREGAAFDIESLYEDYDLLPPTGSWSVHTNHILSHRLLMRDALLAHLTDSAVRHWRAVQMLHASEPRPLDVEDMKRILSDHLGAPRSICRHGVREEDGYEGITKHAIIMDLDEGAMHVSEGAPCIAPFRTFHFS